MTSKFFIATFTTFVDDYKLRGRNPSTSIIPRLFSKEEYAMAYLEPFLRKELKQKDKNFIIETCPEYILKDGTFPSFDDLEYGDLSYILCNVEKGEFVPMTADWSIIEQEVDVMKNNTAQNKKRKLKETN